MKRKNREINVFSVSALDLFASALGAFIVMSMIFMVFFTLTSQGADRAEELRSALDACEAEARTVAEQLDAVNAELESCRRALNRTFVLVLASWSTNNDDVDLHVVDPQGNEFYFADRRHPGSDAAFEEDNERGPGNEVWLHPTAEPGRYRVCYKLFRDSGESGLPDVRGSILWREGKIEIPNVSLTSDDEVRLAAEFEVDADGNVFVNRAGSGRDLGAGGCR